MRAGAARILNTSRVLSPDPAEHARLLVLEVVKAQGGDDEAWQVVVDCMSRLVFRTSETYFWKWHTHMPAQASFDDVFMSGMEGLMIGVRKFDATTGNALTTYASNWVRTKVQRSCYTQCGSARIPEELLQAGLAPDAPLVGSSTMSLDHRLDDDGASLGELLEAPDKVEIDLHDMDGVRRVLDLLRNVDERLPEIAQFVERGYADREIARLTGLTSKRIEQLRGQAQQALRDAGLA